MRRSSGIGTSYGGSGPYPRTYTILGLCTSYAPTGGIPPGHPFDSKVAWSVGFHQLLGSKDFQSSAQSTRPTASNEIARAGGDRRFAHDCNKGKDPER